MVLSHACLPFHYHIRVYPRIRTLTLTEHSDLNAARVSHSTIRD